MVILQSDDTLRLVNNMYVKCGDSTLITFHCELIVMITSKMDPTHTYSRKNLNKVYTS